MMSALSPFANQILELIRENGWEGLLNVEDMPTNHAVPGQVSSGQWVRVSLGTEHRTAPSELVNEYCESIHSLEQIQQECLRALRTGRPGI